MQKLRKKLRTSFEINAGRRGQVRKDRVHLLLQWLVLQKTSFDGYGLKNNEVVGQASFSTNMGYDVTKQIFTGEHHYGHFRLASKTIFTLISARIF